MSWSPLVNPNAAQIGQLLTANGPRVPVLPGQFTRPALVTPPPNAALDDLLEQVAVTLQLTATQFGRAETAYNAVTEWLEAKGSALRDFRPFLSPQGSAALRTTNRPVGRSDYDVDVVCLLQRTGWTAMQVYDAILQRLAEHGTYRGMIERKDRCIRLNYETEFHLDIIPAEPQPLLGVLHGQSAVRIPDRARSAWTPSNPSGYIRWFHEQAETARVLLEKRASLPLPQRATPGDQTVLAMVVQLIKRYRDLQYASPRRADLAPRSIVLTTLVATHYDGQQEPSRALYQVVTGIARAVAEALPGRVAIANPTNPGERFCDKFTDATYTEFVRFVFALEAEVIALTTMDGAGLPDLQPRLDVLFGEEPVRTAILEYGHRVRRASEEKRLRASAATGLTVVGSAKAPGRQIITHRPYGGTADVRGDQ